VSTSTASFRSRTGCLLPANLHGWLPWLFGALLGLTDELAGHRLRLPPDQRALMRSGILSTVILLLATRRQWAHDRIGFECVGLAAVAPAAWLVGLPLPLVVQVFGLFVVCCALPGYAAWHFEADCGQVGVLWPLRASVRQGIPIFLGLVVPFTLAFG
jgi:predicted ABC-type sugar transport system permease subunit